MNTITMIIEASPDSIGAYSTNGEGIYAMGDTIEECKKSVQDAIDTMLEFYEDHKIPEVLKGDYQIVYKYDTESLLKYYKGIITNSALERLTGINQKQIQHYASGLTKPRKEQRKKIEKALHDLGRELLTIRL